MIPASNAFYQYQLFPELAHDEYAALKDDIARRGVLVPVEKDDQGNILDGFHRVRICQELGITDYPVTLRIGLTHEEKIEHALSINLNRRNLTREQRQDVVAKLRGEGWSTRRIAEKLQVGKSTIDRDIETIVPFGTMPDRIATADGRTYPAHRPKTIVAETPREVTRIERALNVIDYSQLDSYSDPQEVFRVERIETRKQRIEELGNPPPLPTQQSNYPVIMADPPWAYEFTETTNRAIENHYPTMDIEAICALDVASMTAQDAILFLWATPPLIEQASRVMRAWGFEYKTCMVWVKDKIGMGYWARQQHELLFIGIKGAWVAPLPADRPSSVINAPRGVHSEKPLLAYELIERMYPGARRLEMFSRSARDGWDTWGLETAA